MDAAGATLGCNPTATETLDCLAAARQQSRVRPNSRWEARRVLGQWVVAQPLCRCV